MATAQAAATTPGFMTGVRAFFGGFGLVFGNPRAYPLAAVPVLAALAIFFGASLLAVLWIPDLVAGAVSTTGFWLDVLQVLASVAAVVVAAFAALVLAQPASGPALEALVRATERKLGLPEHAPTPFFVDVARSAVSAGIGLAVGAIAFVVLFLVGLIPGAAVVTVPLQFVAAAVLAGWDVCDYPLTVRGVGIAHRVAFITRNIASVLGFSAGIALVALVPCGFLLILPVGVAGATRLVAEIERSERVREPKRS